MKYYIIIPAHNEEKYVDLCLSSFVNQTFLPAKLIIVDDNSSDKTYEIAKKYSDQYSWISVFKKTSYDQHVPGKKVIDTFNYGLSKIDSEYDIIGKFDADIILPKNYLEQINHHFSTNPKLGMCSGLLYIKSNNEWIYEAIADRTHIRGPIKLYTKACFNSIGGLRAAAGWDTVDTLLAQFYGFNIYTDASLKVKHLRPTGHSYSKNTKLLKGKALYKMRYGFIITFIASAKMAWKQKNIVTLLHNLKGYFNAKKNKSPYLVTKEEGIFIRKLRWKKIKEKLF